MSVLIVFIQKAIVQGICILYGALGEIMTEKSGNLNLGVPGIMYLGGFAGFASSFFYEKNAEVICNSAPGIGTAITLKFPKKEDMEEYNG